MVLPGVAAHYALDLADVESIASCTAALRASSLTFDRVIFSAGLTPLLRQHDVGGHFLGHLRREYVLEFIETNALGPIEMFEQLWLGGSISIDAKIVFLSSQAGSIGSRGNLAHHRPGGDLAYRISKAALNCAVKNIAYDLSDRPVTIVSLHPGWVKTPSGGPDADLNPLEAGRKIFALVEGLAPSKSGHFLDIDGNEIPW